MIPEPPFQRYVEALLRDLEWQLPAVWGRTIQTIFIGGGSPSLFPPEQIAGLLSGVRARLPLSPGVEVTIEANPGSADRDHFCGYREAGVNRISIGVQSLNDDRLRDLQRIHRSDEAIIAVEAARRAGFERINIDLIYGLPGQSVASALEDLQQAVALETEHLSWYQLTLEPNTPFYQNPPKLPVEEEIWEMEQAGEVLLQGVGLEHYEISAYARSGAACRHNLNYWCYGDYMGLGAGAHAKITDVAAGTIIRTARWRGPERYLERSGSAAVESSRTLLRSQDLPLEFMLNRLRLMQPFSPEEYSLRSGCSPVSLEQPLTEAVELGLMECQKGIYWTTPRGRNFHNDLVALFG